MKTILSNCCVNKRGLPSCLLAILLLGSTGCASIDPWVKPYERNQLADPIMAFGRHPVALQHVAHVQDSREAAKGANGSTGGGCGCN
ncbi:MAG: DUF4266 domain-containing protein [Gammaproteobacteria bacterium]|nr:DUF4266 domain-containing protein [Gammaproteobacteria bacterium]MBU1554394.1 DUF4266 domain-containing protein [Gammaproteobacteria bacterium]MBU2071913.1 DUF4266 domain-containing protein [Gammaproteobacteria bacterium]MBU2181774.1 DUF4266 domain-containing protein [Gammaproteobacteria bacterium]MBU2206362.1 DUF4266 domain-containing protein [Gammaproteobacteria bacterium]